MFSTSGRWDHLLEMARGHSLLAGRFRLGSGAQSGGGGKLRYRWPASNPPGTATPREEKGRAIDLSRRFR